jgi:hypothetical protein
VKFESSTCGVLVWACEAHLFSSWAPREWALSIFLTLRPSASWARMWIKVQYLEPSLPSPSCPERSIQKKKNLWLEEVEVIFRHSGLGTFITFAGIPPDTFFFPIHPAPRNNFYTQIALSRHFFGQRTFTGFERDSSLDSPINLARVDPTKEENVSYFWAFPSWTGAGNVAYRPKASRWVAGRRCDPNPGLQTTSVHFTQLFWDLS